MSTVYVTQIPHKKDFATGTFVPSVNVFTANEHGEVREMFPPRSAYVSTSVLMEQAIERIADYDFEAGDCVLLLGDSAIMAAVLSALTRRVDEFTVLRYDKNIHRYIKVKFDLRGVEV